MKILITGYKGHLGQQFLERYADDYEIVGYDLDDSNDILDKENLRLRMVGCEQVLHLAAIPKPVEGKSFDDYFQTNVIGTKNVIDMASELGLKRVIYASSTTYYGIEAGIPFHAPISDESQPILSQYIKADQIRARDVDLSYHTSKVMAEQILAWYGLNKKIQTVALRFAPIGKVFLGTSVSNSNAAQAINLALKHDKELWYEPFSIVDDLNHISNAKAKAVLGFRPEKFIYAPDKIRSTFDERTT